jgi:hypothetical protein
MAGLPPYRKLQERMLHIMRGVLQKNFEVKEQRAMQTKPTYEQARLQLQIYDLRREARLRQARDWFFKNFHVQTFNDAMHLAGPGTEEGVFTSMVLSYWEQACALLMVFFTRTSF